MASLDQQSEYWNSTGAGKTFTHPLDPTWLSSLDRNARILDYGCGYGRLTAELRERGFTRVEGTDFSPALITRARRQWPALRFTVIDAPPTLPYPGESRDAILLFAVLTCIPTDTGQRELLTELRRLLRPGALLYLSDMCLQSDARNRVRYEAHAAKYGVYGIFETGDGAICRHHDPAWLRSLLSGFDQIAQQHITVTTMNGNPAQITQLLARKPPYSSTGSAEAPALEATPRTPRLNGIPSNRVQTSKSGSLNIGGRCETGTSRNQSARLTDGTLAGLPWGAKPSRRRGL